MLAHLLALTVTIASPDTGWRELSAAAEVARRAGDWADYRELLRRLAPRLPSQPRVLWGLARAEARLQHPDAAFAWLDRYAATGLARDPDADTDLAALRTDTRYDRIAARLRDNGTRAVQAESLFALPASIGIAEDLAYDPAGRRFLVSSVRTGAVLAVDAQGRARAFIGRAGPAGWGALALVVDDARQWLWVSIAAMPQAIGYDSADAGGTALVAFDLRHGTPRRRVELARDGAPHNLGDMSLLPDGRILLADGLGGGLYTYREGDDAIRPFGPAPTADDGFASPQGSAVLADGSIVVADYLRGIARVAADGRAVTWLVPADDVAPSGIDGLRAVRGGVIAMQNGVEPNRVVRLALSRDGRSVPSTTVLAQGTPAVADPTHGVIRDGFLYFIARSGWGDAGDDGAPVPGAAARPPLVARVPLSP